ncbi:helix-turn-helix transcriptional regulator [Salmonella enterica]|nr:helix-turn-helix transcriptional regulator [Salmonella enterica]
MQRKFSKFNVNLEADKAINLTISERYILSLLLKGMTVSEIAARRKRSIKTISTQKRTLYSKFGAKNDVQLLAALIARNVLSFEDTAE